MKQTNIAETQHPLRMELLRIATELDARGEEEFALWLFRVEGDFLNSVLP